MHSRSAPYLLAESLKNRRARNCVEPGLHDGASMGQGEPGLQPCTIAFSIMQWMPFEPFTVCVTRRSAARLQSI